MHDLSRSSSRPYSSGRVRAAAPILVVLPAVFGDGHSMLSPSGPDAGRIANLTWFMVILASLITVVVFLLMVVGLFRDGTRRATGAGSRRLVITGGVALPAVVLSTLSALTLFTLRRAQDPSAKQLAVEVTAHQYWWEVRYPGTGAVTANEIHVPVGREIRLTLRSVDVIHSFWVPALAQKVDMIPGRTNHLVLEAQKPGVYRGQCAEFCGLQHAHMIFEVVAQPAADFERWLHQQTSPAAAPNGADQAAGRNTFLGQACAGCHTIRGTPASGRTGPDLTHVASRATLAAGTVANDGRDLRRWITSAQALKPGALMPDVPLSPQQADRIARYLESLR